MDASPHLCLVSFGSGQQVVVACGVGLKHVLQATGGQHQRRERLLRITATQSLVDQTDGENLCGDQQPDHPLLMLQTNYYNQSRSKNISDRLTFMFLVSSSVHGVQSRLQVVPGEKSFTHPPLLLTQLLEIPEHTQLLRQILTLESLTLKNIPCKI